MTNNIDTIFALATPPGRSGVAILRVSGAGALAGLQTLARDITDKEIRPRYAYLSILAHAGVMIDKAVVIYFKAPHSFTGEDVVEYHLHGSPAVINQLSQFLGALPHHRPAQRGEFTRRGFENGRMDLTEAEAIADLIDAETTAQKDQALSQMAGSLRDLYEGWAADLTRSLAYLEADLDFPDEDLPDGVAAQVAPKLQHLITALEAHLDDNRRGERLRDGIKIAVIGAPNAGKSSLVNALAQRDIAIISDLAGTTRDVLEAHLDIAGYPVILSDTAGLKPELLQPGAVTSATTAHDQIEAQGIARALKVASSADLKLLVFDASIPPDPATLSLQDTRSITVMNKIDCLAQAHDPQIPGQIALSLKDNKGLDDVLAAVALKIKALQGQSDTPALTRQRHRQQVQYCITALHRALAADLPELMAEDVRLAVRALGKITGHVDVEDLLDLIFSEFCIGK